MAIEDIIDHWIASGGEGQYPVLQVTRRLPGTLTDGSYTRAAPTFFNIAASIRPGEGAEMLDELGGRYTLNTQVLYTRTRELFTVEGDTPAPSGQHESDEVTLYPRAAQATLATPHVNGTYASQIVGAYGNAVRLSLATGSSLDEGSLDESAWPAVTFFYKSGVTTTAQYEAALAAGATVAVVTPAMNQAAVLDGTDVVANVAFAGGGGETWRVIKCSRFRRHWKAWIQKIDKP